MKENKLKDFSEFLNQIKTKEPLPHYDPANSQRKENTFVLHFGDEGCGCTAGSMGCYDGKFYLEFGNEGYGNRVFDMEHGKVTISSIPEESLVSLVEKALRDSQGRLELSTNISDLKGSPGYPDYFSWENNVKSYTGKAVLCLALDGNDMEFSYELPEHEEHNWSGW